MYVFFFWGGGGGLGGGGIKNNPIILQLNIKNQQIKEEDKTPIYHLAKSIYTNQKSTKAMNSLMLSPNVL